MLVCRAVFRSTAARASSAKTPSPTSRACWSRWAHASHASRSVRPAPISRKTTAVSRARVFRGSVARCASRSPLAPSVTRTRTAWALRTVPSGRTRFPTEARSRGVEPVARALASTRAVQRASSTSNPASPGSRVRVSSVSRWVAKVSSAWPVVSLSSSAVRPVWRARNGASRVTSCSPGARSSSPACVRRARRRGCAVIGLRWEPSAATTPSALHRCAPRSPMPGMPAPPVAEGALHLVA